MLQGVEGVVNRPILIVVVDLNVKEAPTMMTVDVLLIAVEAQALLASFDHLRRGETVNGMTRSPQVAA